MRYQTEGIGETTYLLGLLPSGETVTIALYDLSDGSAETLTGNACTEIGSTGLYRWSSSNITTQPTSKTEYAYIMTAATSGEKFYGKFVLGGYPDDVTDTLRIVKNKLTIDVANSKLQLWDDAGTAVLYEWPLTDKDGSSINLQAGSPANRGVPV